MQVLTVQEQFGKRVSNVVLMGMVRMIPSPQWSAPQLPVGLNVCSLLALLTPLLQGEPLLNLPAVVKAYHLLNEQVGIGGRFITISTVGERSSIQNLAYLALEHIRAIITKV